MKHIDCGETWYGIHEVYYDEDGKTEGWTMDPVNPQGETLDELKEELVSMVEATLEPVLDYDGEPESTRLKEGHLE
jgi:hypothetical protein